MLDTELVAAGFEILRSRDVGNGNPYVLAARNGVRVSVSGYPESLSIFVDRPRMLYRAILVPSDVFDDEAWEETPLFFAEDVSSLCAWLTEQTERAEGGASRPGAGER